MKKLAIAIISLILLSCEPEYIYDYEYRNGIVVDKEMHTELDPATEFFFDIKTTKVVYSLIVEYNGEVERKVVSESEYYNHQKGDTYRIRVTVK